MECTCKPSWTMVTYRYTVKGKGKQAGLQSARISMSTFTLPQRFLTKIWPKVVACRNCLADGILVLCQKQVQREMEEIEMFSTQLVQESAVQSLGTVFEQIYIEHHPENVVKYMLSAEARELYYKYSKQKKQESLQSAAGTFGPECNAKSNRPFPSSLVPLFQNESKCKTFHIKMCSVCRFIYMQIKVIFLRMILHLDSL